MFYSQDSVSIVFDQLNLWVPILIKFSRIVIGFSVQQVRSFFFWFLLSKLYDATHRSTFNRVSILSLSFCRNKFIFSYAWLSSIMLLSFGLCFFSCWYIKFCGYFFHQRIWSLLGLLSYIFPLVYTEYLKPLEIIDYCMEGLYSLIYNT